MSPSHFLPPTALQAEQNLLGWLICDPSVCHDVASLLRPEHFADPVHGTIFETIQNRVGFGASCNLADLVETFAFSGALDEVGGTCYLVQLASPPPRARAVQFDLSPAVAALAVLRSFALRQTIDAAERMMETAFDAGPDALPKIEGECRALAELISRHDARAPFQP